ncbi:MAG TPA: hypothetical protein DEQ34_11820 [Balneolaceae bacterium]|nr:hypothetical protein [Balneolaceae bacterium]
MLIDLLNVEKEDCWFYMMAFSEYFGSILDKSEQTGCIVFDDQGNIKYGNAAIRNYLGVSLDRLTQYSVTSVLVPQDSEVAISAIQDFIRTKTFDQIFWEIISHQGKIFKFKIEPFLVEIDGINYVAVLVQDAKETALKDKLLNHKYKLEELIRKNELGIKTANLGTWNLDLKDGNTVWNDAMFEMYGITPEEFEADQRIYESLLHPEDADKIINALSSIGSGESVNEAHFRIMNPKKGIRYVKASGAPVYGADGEITHITGVNIDITKEVLSQKKAEESQELLQHITDHIPGMLLRFILHPDGSERFEYLSKGFEKVFGIDPDTSKSDPDIIWDLVYPEDLPSLKASIVESANSLEIWNHNFRAYAKGNQLKYFHGLGTPHQKDDGSVIWDTILHDITKRVEAEESARINNEKLRSLINSSPIGIFQTDENWTIKDIWNEAAKSIFGLKKKHVLGKTLTGIIPGSSNLLQHQLDRIKKKKSPTQFTLVLPFDDDDIKILNLTVGPVFEHKDALTDLLITVSDITDLERYKGSLENSLKEKEVLLMEIHHRVKNNLAIISGLFDLEIMKHPDYVTNNILLDARNRIQSIAIVHEQLYQEMRFSYVNLEEYFDHLLNRLKLNHHAEHLDIKLNTDIRKKKLSINNAVPLGLLVTELFVNSIKYAVQNNALTINCQINADDSNRITVTYSDDGPGFDQKEVSAKNSLGWELINTLLKQLGAEHQLDTTDKFDLTFSFRDELTDSQEFHTKN